MLLVGWPVKAEVMVAAQSAPPPLQCIDSPSQLAQTFSPAQILSADEIAARNNSAVTASSALRANAVSSVAGAPQISYCDMEAQRPVMVPMGTAVSSTSPLPSAARRRSATPGKIVEGSYIGRDQVHNGSEVYCVMEVVADETDPTTIHIHNFYGLDETVDAVVDVDAGTISIMPQRIWQSSSYGDVYMFPISYEDDGIKFYPSSPVTGTIDSEGVITLSQWGAIVGAGSNAGVLLAAIDQGVYSPANATMYATKRSNNTDTKITYPLLVEQDSPYEMTIYNFGTTGVPVRARVDTDGTVTVSPQYIVSMGLYGDFKCFPINMTTGVIDTTSPIVGYVDDGVITFEPWVVGSIMQSGLVALWLTESEVQPMETLTIAIPEAVSFNLQGSGSQTNPWLIQTAADLRAVSEAALSKSFSGKYFKLTADIDMSNEKGFIPIGSATSAFCGTFDGDNHVISNLTIDAVGYHFQGLFGALYEGSVVKNVILRNCSLSGSGYYLGLLAGYSQGELENCQVEGTISGSGMNVGGVIGRSYGALRNCTFSGSASGYGYVGGVAGYSFGEISNCSSDANVSLPLRLTDGAACVGGIAGLVQSYSTNLEGKISDCLFSGTVSQQTGYGFAGGIAGYAYAVTIDRCMNVGEISTTSTSGEDELTGGIVGIIRDSSMADCVNAGMISSAGLSVGVGGLIGYITTLYSSVGGMIEHVYISNSYNSGQVVANAATPTAGVFGTEYILEGFTEKPSDTAFTNVYSDNQATGLNDELFGHPTSFFTGKVPIGFSSSTWTGNEGLYPTLKTFDGKDESRLAQSVVLFADGESTRVMKNQASLAAPSGVTWYLSDEGQRTLATDGLLINDSSLTMRGVYANDTIVAALPGVVSGRRFVINVVPKVFDGEGTTYSPYLIKNKADFIKLDNAIMHYNHEGDYFLQTADVDFDLDEDFAGVAAGNHLREFAGTFDGGNHLIKGLHVKSINLDGSGNTLVGTYNYGGLFHIANASSVIRNVVIDSSCEFEFYGISAPVVGYTLGKVENCRNYADVTGGSSQIGGIAGLVESDASVTGCYNAGQINAAGNYVGGIVGQNFGDIAESQNDADVTATGQYVGGIVGASAGSVSFGVNSATITGKDYTGGVIGSNSAGYGKGDVTDCLSSGLVKSEGSMIGGVVGYSNGRGTVERNWFDSSINNLEGCSSLSQGFSSLPTSEMLVATAPEGFDAEKYAFSTIGYPSLKNFEQEAASVALRSIYIGFNKGEKLWNVIDDVNLSADSKIQWTLTDGSDFSIADGVLKCAGESDKVVTDVLTAVYDNKYSKVFPVKSIPTILEGQGSQESPFLIKSVDDLTLLANFMTSSLMDYEGYYFRVENDIEYGDEDTFKPIARSGVQFKGDFDGNGKTISGINFVDEVAASGKNIGFFGTIGAKGFVHDLTLSGAIKGASYVGSFAGLLYGKIDNCFSSMSVDGKSGYLAGFAAHSYDGSVISNSEFAGIVGDAYTTNCNYVGGFVAQAEDGTLIENCVNKGVVGNVTTTNGTSYTGSQYVGGIVANNLGTIRSCRNEGELRGRMQVGGIAGRIGKTTEIVECVNVSDINIPSGQYVGGIAPQTTGSGFTTISDCYNTGNLLGKGYVAGIVGAITSGNGVQMDNCYNTGSITGYGTTCYAVGGVIGQMQGNDSYPPVVSNCWNEGEIKNVAQSTGGFAGKITSGGLLKNCWNIGNVTVEMETESQTASGVGGLVGSFCSRMEDCWNSGDVVSNVAGVGGLVGIGAMPIAEISRCANFGNVTLTTVNIDKAYGAGGIWGGYGPANIHDCYNHGTISAPDLVGGINAAMWSNGNGGSTIARCYNSGKVIATNEEPVAVDNVANISTASDVDPKLMSIEQAYYDTDVCTEFSGDVNGEGLTKAELMNADLGDEFTYRKACLPSFDSLDDVPIASFYAAHVEFLNGDDADNVNGSFYLGMMPRVIWTVSDNLEVGANGYVTVLGPGEGWIKAVPDDETSSLEKTIYLTLKTSGVDSALTDGKEVEREEWFLLDGRRVANPAANTVCILRTTYTDGTTAVNKVLAND